MGIPRNLSNLAPGASTTGVLAATKGGTGLTSPGASGNVLLSNGTTWTSATPGVGSGFQTYDNVVNLGAAIANNTTVRNIAVQLTATTEMLIISGSSRAYAVVWDDTAKTFGSPVLIRTAALSALQNVAAIRVSATSVLVCTLPNSSPNLETIVLSVSGTTITAGTPVATTLASNSNLFTGFTGTNNGYGRLLQFGSSYVLFYRNSGNFSSFRAITVSGTVPTIGAELQLSSDGSSTNADARAVLPYSSTILLSLSVSSNNAVIYITPVSVSGTTLTAGTGTSLSSSNANLAGIGMLASGRAIFFYSEPLGNYFGVIVNVSGTTATVSTVDTALPFASNSIYTQIIGSQAVFIGNNTTSLINVVTDSAGTAVLGNAIATPDGTNELIGFSGTTVYTQSATNNRITDYQLSGNNVVYSYRPAVTIPAPDASASAIYRPSLRSYASIGYANLENASILKSPTNNHVNFTSSLSVFIPAYNGVAITTQPCPFVPVTQANRSALNLFSAWYVAYVTQQGNTINIRRIELS